LSFTSMPAEMSAYLSDKLLTPSENHQG
jgi:hypothetical protein